ncbi:MAG: PSD1 domain-containing protein, partial [Planctomycetaceae bacterium]|nr:PSD1 domain-containing protein [Planctomycetaceae bacterium]
LLTEHCASCHGGVKKNGGFSVLSRELMLSPANSGVEALQPGNAAQSELIRRITSTDSAEQMPPEGQDPLTSREKQLLHDWIQQGATWPSHWAYAALPDSGDLDSDRHLVDRFVRDQLDNLGLTPSPPASGAMLVRRMFLDLTGLLPEPAELQQLNLSDEMLQQPLTTQDVERLADYLLASPHFGERWARHWLDEARYADSEGYEKDSPKEDAWRFRDWVIQAINDDLPFSEFTRRQIAGDLLPNHTAADLIATKFHLQTQFNLEGGVDSEEDRTKRVIDRVGTVGSVWLGTSIGCCQCHDHPYDSLRQQDFYRLYAFFNNADFAADFLDGEPKNADALRQERAAKWAKIEALLAKQVDDKDYSDDTQRELSSLRGYDNSKQFTRFLQERTKDRRHTYVFARGDFLQPQVDDGEILPGFPNLAGVIDLPPNANRLDLANWLIDPVANPLPPRVVVNKVWMHLFGQALADQPQEFGSRGSVPSHPELLDALASWFVHDGGWSRKQLIRLIVTSETYRQSSVQRPEIQSVDPGNRVLTRQNRFRVEAEILRDITLQTAGLLNRSVGGTSVFPPLPEIIAQQTYAGSFKYKASEGPNRYRRGLYTFFRRTAIDPNLSTFDCPDSSLTRAQRDRSNTPLQALATLHNEVFHEAAQAFARRLLTDCPDQPEVEQSQLDDQRLRTAFQLALSRTASDEELQPLRSLLETSRGYYREHASEASQLHGPILLEGVDAAEQAAWTTVARVVLNLDEFLTRP